MGSFGMFRRVDLVKTDVSKEPSASFIRLVAASVVPSSSILVTLMKEALGSSETSVITRATRRNIPEDAFLHSHRRENLKSYISNPYLSQEKYHISLQFPLVIFQNKLELCRIEVIRFY
jgi:hypothetical protein